MEINLRPNPKQHLAYEALRNPEIDTVFFGGGAGGGKEQPLDAIVQTPFGSKLMGEIEVGDQVSNPDGSIARVVWTHPQGEKDIYRVVFVDGASCEVGKNHLWIVRRMSKHGRFQKRKSDRPTKWRIVTTEFLESELASGKRYAIPLAEAVKNVLPTRSSSGRFPIKPYALGAMLGDGRIGTSLREFLSIKWSRRAEAKCITVDHPNGLYLTNDFIVTHNSWFICESRLVNCLRFPGYKSFIGREELKRLMSSTFLTWAKVCKFHSIPQNIWSLNGQYNYVEFSNGSRIDLLDLKALPSDPLFERFGSTEYSDGAIEEAGEVTFLAYDVLRSRLGRHLNKELGIRPTMLITGNPKKNWTYSEFYKPWKKGILSSNTVFIQALYKDNRETADEYGKVLERIKDKQTKERLMFGNWEYDDDPSSLIAFDAISDLFTNAVPRSTQSFLTCDVARFGKDKIVMYLWKGLSLEKVWIFQKMGIDQTIRHLKEIAMDECVPYSHILVDEDGVGGGVMDGMQGIRGFVANSRPLEGRFGEKENFENLKSQCCYKLADLVSEHRLGIHAQNLTSGTIEGQGEVEMTFETWKEALIEELSLIRSKDADKDGKKKIMPKEDVKERLGRSPDFSDTLMMRMYFELDGTSDDSSRGTRFRTEESYFDPLVERGGIRR